MAYKWMQRRAYRFENGEQTVDYFSCYKIGSADNFRTLRSSGWKKYGTDNFTLTWEEYKNRDGFKIYRKEEQWTN